MPSSLTTIKYRHWELTVDKELTEHTYNEMPFGSAEGCACNDCKNFINFKEYAYPDEVKDLFAKLGIDYHKESEVSHMTRLQNGLHYYSGWFHFKGSFKGKDCTLPLPGGNGYTLELTPITERFSIGFRTGNALTFFRDRENLVQVEFDAIIPWTIDKELESP